MITSHLGNPSINYIFQHEIRQSYTFGGGGACAIIARAITGEYVSLTFIHPKNVLI
jgi:hypothetical protein